MARTGDEETFAAWVRPSRPAMTRLARRLAPAAGAAGAEDIVQDALERAWAKRDQFDATRGTPTTWLLAITADRARDSRRSRARRLRLVDDTSDSGALAAEAAAEPAGYPDIDLERAIRALPARQQLAIHVHYFVGCSVAETAAVMGCSEGTVKSTLFDARASLRRELGDDDD